VVILFYLILEKPDESNPKEEEKDDIIKLYNGIKKERKNLEESKKSLDNRVSLLEREQVKVIKKTEDTKHRAEEIYMMKKKKEEQSQKVFHS
jgi:hypothetical protein